MKTEEYIRADGQVLVLPPEFSTLEFSEVLEWYATKVLELDEENRLLKAKVAAYERRTAVQARANSPSNSARYTGRITTEGPGPNRHGLSHGPGIGQGLSGT